MLMRPLGTSGIRASSVGLGTWQFGGWMWGGNAEADSVEAVHAWLDAGANLIDTAPIYGFGLSEEIVGKAIRKKRDQVVLATKAGMVTNTTEGEHKFQSDAAGPKPHGHIGVYILLRPESMRVELERSLKRLQTDYIDLYQTHWQESTTPVEDTMAELLKMKEEGKIRSIGASNATVDQLKRYAKAGRLDVDQERYSMFDRQLDAEQAPWCDENDVAILAYSPLAQGLLTGKMTPDREFEPGDQRREDPRFSENNRRRVQAMLEGFKPIAERHDATIAQLTIAWTIRQRGITHALVGARDGEQATENARAGTIDLSEDEVKIMSEAIDAEAAQVG